MPIRMSDKAGAGMSKTILAVDDSGSLRQILAFSLKAAGYGVIEAVDGQDGLDKAKQQQVDMVLTDQNMPGMDGLSLIRALRNMKNYQKVPILMLTTESGDDMKAQGRAAGANGWLVKPFDPARLTEVVKKLIG
jgi:two-component system chemotaxis response regulator CheY